MMTESAHPQSSFALPIHDTTLANGLRVIVLPKYTASVVSIAVAYRVGSKDERQDNTGFAHLFEHLMFEGSSNLANGEFDRLCTQAGGSNNAYTTNDKTLYYMVLPSRQLELGLWLEADRMANFNISEHSLDVQKNVVIEEIHQNVENQPYGSLSAVQSRLAYAPQSSYSWEVYGDKEHIAQSSLEDVRDFHREFYRPDNACLVVCGDVSPAQTIELAANYFGTIPSGNDKVRRNPYSPDHRQGNQYEQIADNISLEGVFLSYHCSNFRGSEYFTLEILASILSDGMSARLNKTLVYDLQLASETGAYIDEREHSSLFNIYAVSNGPSVDCAALNGAVQEILRDIADNGVSMKELIKAQNRMATRMARQFSRSTGIAEEVAHQTLFFDDPQRSFTLTDSYAAVTADDIQTVAKEIFRQDNQIRIDFVPKD